MDRSAPMLQVEDLHVAYGNIPALRGAELHVLHGEACTLIGSNGAGKSTLLNALCGLLRPMAGTVRFEGREIQGARPHRIVGLGISQVPEGRKIFSRLTVEENLDMGAYLRRDAREVRHDKEVVFALFPRLEERRVQLAGTLSGGEQQMLAVGRALMARPRLLLLDEPSMGLAPLLVEGIFETLVDINRHGTTLLLVEQNAVMALCVASRGYVMQNGRVILGDTTDRLQRDPLVKALYLGEDVEETENLDQKGRRAADT